MIVYKVVRKSRAKDPNRYLSAIVNKKALVIYKVGEWAVAPQWLSEKGLDLVAFDNLKEARDFAERYSRMVVFEAEADDCIHPGRTRWAWWHVSDGFVQDDQHQGGFSWPFGTIMCKRLMLLKKVA